jgi:hypothetical protein
MEMGHKKAGPRGPAFFMLPESLARCVRRTTFFCALCASVVKIFYQGDKWTHIILMGRTQGSPLPLPSLELAHLVHEGF